MTLRKIAIFWKEKQKILFANSKSMCEILTIRKSTETIKITTCSYGTLSLFTENTFKVNLKPLPQLSSSGSARIWASGGDGGMRG